MRALNIAQMREADARASEKVGATELMREAGRKIAAHISRLIRERRVTRPIVAFAGPGNNGGDAYAAFAELDPTIERIVYTMESPSPSDARSDSRRRALESGAVERALPTTYDELLGALDGASIAIDALLGTGARVRASGDPMTNAIRALNACSAHVLAIDIPTGADADTGAVADHCVDADETIMLGAAKYGLFVGAARDHARELLVADIGMSLENLVGPRVEVLSTREFIDAIPKRTRESDKRISGAPLIIAGSEQFPGAAVLCAHGAARSGAGYVTVATEAAAAATLRSHLIEQVVVAYDANEPDAAIETLLDLTDRCTSVAIGPGLGLGKQMGEIVRGFCERVRVPFIVDASALFHFSKHLEILRGKRCVLTPHEGEFARLSGEGTIAPGTRRERLRAFVARTGIATLLKGAATLIDDGETLYVNATGTSALATAGTGDVLSGMIATLLSQGLEPARAAAVAAHWHGEAGGSAQVQRTLGVVASDVAEQLGHAFQVASIDSGFRSYIATFSAYATRADMF